MSRIKRTTPCSCPEPGDEIIVGSQHRCEVVEGPRTNWTPDGILFLTNFSLTICPADPNNPPVYDDGVQECPITKATTFDAEACDDWGPFCHLPNVDLNAGDVAILTWIEPCTETIDVLDPASITLEKMADLRAYEVDDVITYSFKVTNDGGQTVSGIVLDDLKLGLSSFAVTPQTLAPGECAVATATYTATQVDVDAGTIVNTAIASGTAQDSSTVADQAQDTIVACPVNTFAEALNSPIVINGITVMVTDGQEGTAMNSNILPEWLHTNFRPSIDDLQGQGWQDYLWKKIAFSSPVTIGDYFTVLDLDAETAQTQDVVAVIGFNGGTPVLPASYQLGSGVVASTDFAVVNSPTGFPLPATIPSHQSTAVDDVSATDMDYSVQADFGSQQVDCVFVMYAVLGENDDVERLTQGVIISPDDPLQNIPELACDKS